MKHKLVMVMLSVMLVVGLTLAGCVPEAAPEVEEEIERVVKIGALLPMTGVAADTGNEHMKGHVYAVERINEKEGGIKSLGGAKIELVLGDTKSDKTEGASEVEKLITVNKVLAISGAYQSAVTLPSSTVAQRYKVPFLVDSAISDEITQRDFEWVFRPHSPAIGWAAGQFAFLRWLNENYSEQMGGVLQTVGFLYEDTAYGQSTAEGWKVYAPKEGFDIVMDLPYPAGTADITSEFGRMKAADPDVIIQVSYAPDAILSALTMEEIGYTPRVYLTSGGGHSTREFQEAIGHRFEGLFNMIGTWNLDVETPFNEYFPAEYEARWDIKPASHSAQGAGNAYILRDALEIAGASVGGWEAWSDLSLEAQREEIRKALDDYETTDSPPIYGYITKVDFKDWDNWTNQMSTWTPGIVQMRDGEYRSVFPAQVAAVEPSFELFLRS